MKINRFSLYQLHTTNGLILDQNLQLFDAISYSKFKYGLGNVSQKYALEMFGNFFQNLAKDFERNTLYITSSAYKFTPTASHSIASHLFHFLQMADFNTRKIKIHRDNLFESDYGSLSLFERKKIMNETCLFFDHHIDLSGQSIIVVDDVRITGSHEEKIKELLISKGVKEIFFVYVAEFVSVINPSVEDEMNHAYVKNIFHLKPLFDSPCFQLNARICKFLLSYQNKHSFINFLDTLKAEVLNKILIHIYGDNYERMPSYQRNYEILLEVMENKEIFSGTELATLKYGS